MPRYRAQWPESRKTWCSQTHPYSEPVGYEAGASQSQFLAETSPSLLSRTPSGHSATGRGAVPFGAELNWAVPCPGTQLPRKVDEEQARLGVAREQFSCSSPRLESRTTIPALPPRFSSKQMPVPLVIPLQVEVSEGHTSNQNLQDANHAPHTRTCIHSPWCKWGKGQGPAQGRA